MASSLFRCCIHEIRIPGIANDVVDTGVVTDVQNVVPGFAATFGLIRSAVASRSPRRPLCRHEDKVGIAGIDVDFPNLPRILQPHACPVLAAVKGFIDSIAVTECPLAVVFARAGPNDIRVLWIHSQTSDGMGAVIIKNRPPCRAGVDGFPDVATRDRHIICVLIDRAHREVGNAS